MDRGALIKRIEPGGSADLAGLEAGYVVTAVDDQPVRNLHQLHEGMARREVGETVTLRVWRRARRLILTPSGGRKPA